MADETAKRFDVQIGANIGDYNKSIDTAIARTKAFQVQQKKLVEDLNRNQAAQVKTAKSLENAAAKYGKDSEQAQKLAKKLESLTAKEQTLGSQLVSINKALDSQQREFSKTSESAGKAEKGLSGLSNQMSSITKLMTGLVTMQAGKSFLQATIGSLSEFEQYETSFGVMMGDMEKAKALMEDLKDFAAKTPFEMTDVVPAANLLMNYGVAAEDLITTMTRLGDLSQGNAEKLDRISLAYGQMLAKGKVTGEELRQITEAGVPLTQALADGMGIATSELMGFIEKSKVGIPQLNAAIESLTTGTGKFAGMMEKQSQTLAGQWSTLKDNIGQFARDIGEDAFAETKNALSDISKEFDRMKKSGELAELAKSWGSTFSLLTKVVLGTTEAVVKNKEAVSLLIATYGAYKILQQVVIMQQAYNVAIKEGTKAQAVLNAVTKANPYVLIAAGLATVIGLIAAFVNKSNAATKEIREQTEAVKEQRAELKKLSENNYDISAGSEEYAKLEYASEDLIDSILKLDSEIQRSGVYSEESAGAKELLKLKVQELNGVMGKEVATFEEATGTLNMNTEEIRKNIESMKEQALATAAAQKMEELYQQKISNTVAVKTAQAELKKLQDEYDQLTQKANEYSKSEDPVYPAQAMEEFGNRLHEIVPLIEEQKKLIEETKGAGDDLDTALDVLSKTYGDLAANAEKSAGSVNAAAAAASDLSEQLTNAEKKLETLNAAQQEAQDSGKLSSSTLQSLAASYSSLEPYIEDYLAGIIDEKELISQFPALYEQEKNAQKASILAKMQTSEKFYQSIKDDNIKLFKALADDYGLDYKNWKSLAQAKGEVETQLINTLGSYWAEYYQKVGGNSEKVISEMESQLKTLKSQKSLDLVGREQMKDLENAIANMKKFQKDFLEFDEIKFEFPFESSLGSDSGSTSQSVKSAANEVKTWQEKLYEDLKYQKAIGEITEQEYVDGLIKIRDSYYQTDEENYRKYNQEIYSLQTKAAENSEKLLKSAFDDQLKAAKEYYDQQKQLVEDSYQTEIDAINAKYDKRLEKAKAEYEAEKDRVDGIIEQLNREIQARQQAREDEKLDDDLSFAQKRIQTLQAQISYARTPEEKSELEKELKRQQEELKDLSLQKEVNELEAEKKIHEERLSNMEEEYALEEERIEKRRKKALAAAEEARNEALQAIEDTFTAFNNDLYNTYGYINTETVAIGERFANATNTALDSGFTAVANKAREVVDDMMERVQKAISRLNSAISRANSAARSANERSVISTSDNRSMTVTNNISRGLTESQVSRMMDLQAERLLYERR